MPIRQITSPDRTANYMNERVKLYIQVLVNSLQYVGEEVLRIARDEHKYIDRTGNLTSSMGYCIVLDGRVITKAGFGQIMTGTEGSSEGQKFLDMLISNNSKGLVFIMVAGMPYAEYVEDMGLDVLASAEIAFESKIKEILRRLNF